MYRSSEATALSSIQIVADPFLGICLCAFGRNVLLHRTVPDLNPAVS